MRSGPKEEWTLPAPVPVSPLPEVYLTPYRYYHTLFTHSLPKTLRTLADDTPTCVDVLMNFLVATVTKLPPIKVPYGRQHQEDAPLVRALGELVLTRKARVGKGNAWILSCHLIQIFLAAAGVGVQKKTSFMDTFPFHLLGR